MDELIKQTAAVKDMTGLFTIWDVAITFALSALLSFFIAKVYQVTHRGISYSQNFVETLVLMATVVSLIMLIIGSNIARAFALVGALSIIRFRNAVKDSKDVGFVFFAMAIGMACGTGFYLLAIFATAAICAVMFLLYKLQPFAQSVSERILMVQVPEDFPHEVEFDRLFQKYFLETSLIGIETVLKGDLIELIYSVNLKGRFKAEEFLREMRKATQNHKVTLVEGQQEIDF